MTLSDRSRLEAFACRIRECAGTEVPDSLSFLWQAYDVTQGHPEAGRLLAALVDLHLNLVLLLRDLDTAAGVVNQESPGDPLADRGLFSERMNLYHANSSFVLRLRACWDKVMGVFVLLVMPAEHERFVSSGSRKKRFAQLVEGRSDELHRFAKAVEASISEVDDRFRTAEAHGSGTLRKWAFEPGVVAPAQGEIFWAWNDPCSVVGDLVEILELITAHRTGARTPGEC